MFWSRGSAQVSHVLGRLSFCPPELLIGVWSIRGYGAEKLGQLELAGVDYLQARFSPGFFLRLVLWGWRSAETSPIYGKKT